MTEELIGRMCLKLTGREAGKIAVIVDILDKNFVLIDGNVKRRRCNISHLELTEKKLDIKKGASTSAVYEAMKKENIEFILKKEKKQIKEKPIKKRKTKEKVEKPKEKKLKDEKQRTKKKVPRISNSNTTSKSDTRTNKHNKQ